MPIDHFAILHQPRRPWLDPEALKETFHQITAAQHPDMGGQNADFAEINTAYTVLRDPASRLRHLLELEAPEEPGNGGHIPEKLAAVFMRVATLRQAIDDFMKQHQRATTPLAQALLASEQLTLQRDVEKEQASLDADYALGLEALQAADREWPAHRAELTGPLRELQQELAYLSKWSSQIREDLFQFESLR